MSKQRKGEIYVTKEGIINQKEMSLTARLS